MTDKTENPIDVGWRTILADEPQAYYRHVRNDQVCGYKENVSVPNIIFFINLLCLTSSVLHMLDLCEFLMTTFIIIMSLSITQIPF